MLFVANFHPPYSPSVRLRFLRLTVITANYKATVCHNDAVSLSNIYKKLKNSFTANSAQRAMNHDKRTCVCNTELMANVVLLIRDR